MKRAFLLVMLAAIGGACGSPRNVEVSLINNAVASRPQASPKSEPTVTSTETPRSKIVATLERSKGKYPYEIKLLENAELKARLKKLLRADFAQMTANWNVETPIEIENGILMTSGCEKHNCGNNIYFMFVDLARDNINVYHLENGEKIYTEAARIDLPKKLADEMSPE